MNILSQKETRCTCGGSMLGNIKKQAKKKAQEIIDETKAAVNKKIADEGQAILDKIKIG